MIQAWSMAVVSDSTGRVIRLFGTPQTQMAAVEAMREVCAERNQTQKPSARTSYKVVPVKL